MGSLPPCPLCLPFGPRSFQKGALEVDLAKGMKPVAAGGETPETGTPLTRSQSPSSDGGASLEPSERAPSRRHRRRGLISGPVPSHGRGKKSAESDAGRLRLSFEGLRLATQEGLRRPERPGGKSRLESIARRGRRRASRTCRRRRPTCCAAIRRPTRMARAPEAQAPLF